MPLNKEIKPKIDLHHLPLLPQTAQYIFKRFGWCNGQQAWQANLHEWIKLSLGAPFIQPRATSKQKRLVNYNLNSFGV